MHMYADVPTEYYRLLMVVIVVDDGGVNTITPLTAKEK